MHDKSVHRIKIVDLERSDGGCHLTAFCISIWASALNIIIKRLSKISCICRFCRTKNQKFYAYCFAFRPIIRPFRRISQKEGRRMRYCTPDKMIKMSKIPRLLFQLRHYRECLPARTNGRLYAHSQSTTERQLLSTWSRCMRRRRSNSTSELDYGFCSMLSRNIRELRVDMGDSSRQPKIIDFHSKLKYLLPPGCLPR